MTRWARIGNGARTRLSLVLAALLVASLTIAGHATTAAAAATPGAPTRLTTNGMRPAIGVDPDAIQFAWRVTDPARGALQSTYRILVSRQPTSRPGSAGIVWDTGRVRSAQQAFVPYTGPRLQGDAQYWWTVSTGDGAGTAGAFARPVPFVTVPRTADWHAQWVTPGASPPSHDEMTYVRTTVHVGSGPIVRATAYIAASHQYQLWVNGHRAAAGPSFSYPDEQYVEATDVTARLRSGANGIGVLHHWYGPGQGRPAGQPGLLAEISVTHRDGSHEVFGTDGTWRETPAEWSPGTPRNDEGDFTEIVDGRGHPAGWSTPAFDDAAWHPIAVLGPPGTPPFTDLVAQRTRIARHAVRPQSVRTLPSGSVVADYGAIDAASPVVRFRHGVAGHPVTMRAGFALAPDGSVSATHENQGTDMSYRYTQPAGSSTFAAYGYLAFRYLEVDDPGEPLSAGQLTIEARHAAMPAGDDATFRTSDPKVDAVWSLTRRSALYVSQEQFVDTPTREKGQFLLDSYDDSQATTRAFGEQNLTWQALRDFARSQSRYWPDGRLNVVYPNSDGARDIPDNTERYPDWLWQYFVATGDRATLRELAPVATRVASYIAAATDPTTGLVTKLPGGGEDYLYGAVDWPPPMRYGYDMATVARTTVNALAAEAYARVADMADALGDVASAAAWRSRLAALATAMNGRLRRPDGTYVDGLEADGSMSQHVSQQANAFALDAGIVPLAAHAAVGSAVAALRVAMGPDNGLVLLRALHDAGRDADVRRILTDATGPGWAQIVAQHGTFTWETWAPDDADGDSTSHGWGSAALAALPETFLGVTTVAPGRTATGARLAVVQPDAGLARASGTVPTVSGPVAVAWRRGAGTELRLHVPANVSVRVAMRARTTGDVTESGHPIRGGPGIRVSGARAGIVELTVGAGSWSFRAA
ncbi:MAG TPA: alpha-L-rhamnosidase N-terminal domain-containing protein [Acidimicrobiia bacterium]